MCGIVGYIGSQKANIRGRHPYGGEKHRSGA